MNLTSTCHNIGLPQLDIYTLSEDWALATALEKHWGLLSKELGLQPSNWLDGQGDRMYGAVLALSTWFDLADVVREDDTLDAETALISIRKPHALSLTRYIVDGRCKAEVRLLSSLIKRKERGSNKKFAKVRNMWTGEDRDGEAVDGLLDRHHGFKNTSDGVLAMTHEVNRIRDFNTADFMYFKNYVGIAKAAEWRENRGRPVRLNSQREAWFYGNVEDGEEVNAYVSRDGDDVVTTLRAADGRLILASQAKAPVVQIATR